MNKELLIRLFIYDFTYRHFLIKSQFLKKYLPKEYEGWVNVYCDEFIGSLKGYNFGIYNFWCEFRGKVAFRFWFDQENVKTHLDLASLLIYVINEYEHTMLDFPRKKENDCDKKLRTWNNDNVEIFYKPKELSDFTIIEPITITKSISGFVHVYAKEVE